MNKRIYIIILVVITLAVFANSFRNGFVLDDKFIIETNKTIRDIGNLPEFFKSDYWAGTRYEGESSALYRPLVIATFAFDYLAWKLHPAGYHLLNLLVHILNCLLIFYIVNTILGKHGIAGLCAALLFAVHPVHVEAVTGIVGRAELMATLFFLAAFAAYARKKRAYIVSLGFFGLALLCKESALTLPGIIVLYDLYKARLKGLGGRLKYYAGYLGVILFYFVLRWFALGTVFSSAGRGIFYKHTTATRLMTMSRVFVYYFRLMFFPAGLRTDYNDFSFSTGLEPAVILSGLFLVLFLAILVTSYNKKKIVFLALGWYLVCLLPVSNIIPFGAIMAERFLYLPSVGLCLLAGVYAGGLWNAKNREKRRNPYRVLLVALLVIFSAGTIKYNSRWYSNDTLWNYAAKKSPGNGRIQYALGVVHLEKGEYRQAAKAFEKALELDSDMPEAYNNLAVCYNSLKQYDKSIQISNTALAHKPDYFEAYINMGNAYRNKNDFSAAAGAYNKALEINPKSVDALYNLGLLYYGMKDYDIAIKNFLAIIEFDRKNENAWIGLGAAYIKMGEITAAVKVLGEALQILPKSALVHDRLGLAHFYAGDYRKAIEVMNKSMEFNPADQYIRNRLGSAYGNLGLYDKALEEFRKALEIDPNYSEAKDNYNKLKAFMARNE